MTGPTASLNVSVPLPGGALPSFLTVGASVMAPAKASVAVPGAVPNLATFVDLMIGKVVAPRPKPPGGLQETTAPGKSLPEGDGDHAVKAFAWLFAPVPTAPSAAVAPPIDLPESAGDIHDVAPVATSPGAKVGDIVLNIVAPTGPDPIVVGPVAPVPVATSDVSLDSLLKATPAPVLLTDIIAPVAPTDPTPGPTPVALDLPEIGAPLPPVGIAQPPVAAPDPAPLPIAATPPVAQPLTEPVIGPVAPTPALPTDPNVSVELRVRRNAVATPRPAVVTPTRTPTAQPVQAVIAQIIAGGAAQPALFALAAGRERSADDERAPISAAATAAILLQPADAAALVAQPGGAQGSALDMGRQDWPQRMIDRIEALRDDADAADTSIRLKPDALGRIDVAVRTHADGAISVRFAADQPATRTLLADAQPQLHAAAEARGIKLTGGVDLGSSGGQPERGQSRFEAKANSTNHPGATAEDSEAAGDSRIA